jgi:hypothetical protein
MKTISRPARMAKLAPLTGAEIDQIKRAIAQGMSPNEAATSLRSEQYPEGLQPGSLRYLLLKSGVQLVRETTWDIRPVACPPGVGGL